MKRALIVIDMQNDFIDGALGTREAKEIVPRVAKKVMDYAKDPEAKVIFTRDTHGRDYLTTLEGKNLPREHCIKPSVGWEICRELLPYTKDALVVEKPTFGAPGLAPLVSDADEIAIVGLCTDICVIVNALLLKSFLPETPIKVVADCCAGVTPESHERALEAMRMCQIEICEK